MEEFSSGKPKDEVRPEVPPKQKQFDAVVQGQQQEDHEHEDHEDDHHEDDVRALKQQQQQQQHGIEENTVAAVQDIRSGNEERRHRRHGPPTGKQQEQQQSQQPPQQQQQQQQEDKIIESIVKSLRLIPRTHITVGIANIYATHKEFQSLVLHQRMPEYGWSDMQIQHLLYLLSMLDTNNKFMVSSSSISEGSTLRWCGVGEREGRTFSTLVAQRHYGMTHGIGRSGDISEPQPKAVGSSIIAQLAIQLVLDLIRRGCGLNRNGVAAYGILLPLCTGMSLSLVLSSIRNHQYSTSTTTSNNNNSHKRLVLWSRIDQKSCYKAIVVAGLTCIVIPTMLVDDQVMTNVLACEELIQQYTASNILAIVTTTSCFAPRIPDDIDQIGKLCLQYNIYHIVNHAYGLQSPMVNKLINRAGTIGRVDAIICSTDKNFLVPVGGAIVLSSQEKVIQDIGKLYAGRACASPMMDLFITLLSMGLQGYKQLFQNRLNQIQSFTKRFHEIAQKHNERLLHCPRNEISFGITLDTLVARPQHIDESNEIYWKSIGTDISHLGSMLFRRCVSGTRVIPRYDHKVIQDQTFLGYGSSYDNYPHAYLTAACAIGVSNSEIDEFFLRLDKVLHDFKKQQQKKKKDIL